MQMSGPPSFSQNVSQPDIPGSIREGFANMPSHLGLAGVYGKGHVYKPAWTGLANTFRCLPTCEGGSLIVQEVHTSHRLEVGYQPSILGVLWQAFSTSLKMRPYYLYVYAVAWEDHDNGRASVAFFL